ncbi:putative glycine hydroxymethyltransferase [Helianthus debilis subsp. tardiflorus]
MKWKERDKEAGAETRRRRQILVLYSVLYSIERNLERETMATGLALRTLSSSVEKPLQCLFNNSHLYSIFV